MSWLDPLVGSLSLAIPLALLYPAEFPQWGVPLAVPPRRGALLAAPPRWGGSPSPAAASAAPAAPPSFRSAALSAAGSIHSGT
eukprot:8998773-Pyramimonas_sp.AAC.1